MSGKDLWLVTTDGKKAEKENTFQMLNYIK